MISAATAQSVFTTTSAISNRDTAALESKLKQLLAEVLSIHAGFQALILGALRQERESGGRGYLERLREEERLQAEFMMRVERLSREIDRVGEQLNVVEGNVTTSIEDPAIDRSWVMKRKGEERVLRAYLDGLRFSEPAD